MSVVPENSLTPIVSQETTNTWTIGNLHRRANRMTRDG